MTKRDVMINITTVRSEVAEDLFSWDESEVLEPEEGDFADDPAELLVEGRLVTGKKRVELIYEESELTGMAGSVTVIGFDRDTPGLLSMMRNGPVETALVFEEGKRHFSVYNTPYSDFQVGIYTMQVKNSLLETGTLYLDYLVELRGAKAERCRMTVTVKKDTALETGL